MQLIIDTYGLSLSCENGMFCIRGKHIESENIPVREVKSIQLGRGVRVTSDAVFLAIENNIRVLFMKGSGMPAGHVWHGHFGSIASIRKAQLRFAESPEGLAWMKGVLEEKANRQIALMYRIAYVFEDAQSKILGNVRQAEQALGQLKSFKIEARAFEPDRIKASFRGWEGTCSRYYFQSLSLALPEGYRFGRREGRPATDRFNCALNYAYGILYGQVETALIQAGVDPQIGVFHADQYAKPVMAFDVIEPYRVWADEVVFLLCHAHVFSEDCFQPQGKGMWLTQKGKKPLVHALFGYLGKAPPTQQQRRSREAIINRDATALARQLLDFGKKQKL